MIVAIVVIVLIVLLFAYVTARRRNKREVTYAPDVREMSEDLFNPGTRFNIHEIPQVAVPTPEVATEEIAHDEFVGDASDDLLDPRNPHHAEWVKQHPEMETDAEWVAEHPEDNPS
jgi:hypothetical protein